MLIKGIFGHIGKRLPIYERGQGSEAGLNCTLNCPKLSRENVLPYKASPHASNEFNFKSGMTEAKNATDRITLLGEAGLLRVPAR